MMDLRSLITHALKYYDLQIYLLKGRPVDNGRLKAAVWFASCAVHPRMAANKFLATSRAIVAEVASVRHTLVRERPKSVLDRAEEIGVDTLKGLDAFASAEAGKEDLYEPMIAVSMGYLEALADASGITPIEEDLKRVSERDVPNVLGAWSQLRELPGGESVDHLYEVMATTLFERLLEIPRIVDKYFEGLEQGTREYIGTPASSGKYPVPTGTRCLFCDTPAHGSVGDDSHRDYLCLKHLREIASGQPSRN